jgi:penicillin-binding protein 1A
MGHDDPRSLGEGESGGGLALPIWIDAMGRALRGVPPAPLPPPTGVVAVGNDWRFAQFEGGGFVAKVGEAGLFGAAPAPVDAAASAVLPASPVPPVSPVPAASVAR